MRMLFTSKLSDYIHGNRISTATDGGGSTQQRWGCLKSWLLFRHPREFKIKSLYSNDLILNIASKSKETVRKLKFSDSPTLIRDVCRMANSSVNEAALFGCRSYTFLLSVPPEDRLL